jgi:carnitine 3-dehydrogenase
MDAKPVSDTIGVIGTGVIGAGWAAYFLAKGFDVAASDPAEGAETRLRTFVDTAWPTLEQLGLADGASPSRLRFEPDIARACTDCYFVQESGPERMDLKRDLLAKISAVAPRTSLIATSSSGILISDIQDAAVCPERVVVGHPFNPPHLMPLVEVVAGRLTSDEWLATALQFYGAIGKKPVHIRSEVKGHVANRLQAALWREAFYLVQQGVVSVADVDAVVADGPGLRWALLGPFLNLHLSGGAGGITHVLEHLGPPLETWWRDLGDVSLNDKLNGLIVRGLESELAGVDLGDIVTRRDQLLLDLLKLKACQRSRRTARQPNHRV